MNHQQAQTLLGLSDGFDAAAIKKAYSLAINKAEDQIDDARTAAAEDQAWEHYKKLQQARSHLLKALESGTLETTADSVEPASKAESVEEKPEPHALPLNAEQALHLLDLQGEPSFEQVQMAYEQKLHAIDRQIEQCGDAQEDELWDIHKQVQQARYVLINNLAAQPQNDSVETAAKPELSKKQIHAFALLGVNADSSQSQVRAAYNKKIDAIEDKMGHVKSSLEEDELWDEHRAMQRAFGIANASFKDGQEATTKTSSSAYQGVSNSPHQKFAIPTQGSVDDFVSAQKRSKRIKQLGLLTVVLLVGGAAYYLTQMDGLQQLKAWQAASQAEEAPKTPEEQSAQLLTDVQNERKALKAAIQAVHDTAAKAAREDSDDYPQLANIRNQVESKIAQAPEMKASFSLLKEAEAALEAGDLEKLKAKAEAAREKVIALQAQLKTLQQAEK